MSRSIIAIATCSALAAAALGARSFPAHLAPPPVSAQRATPGTQGQFGVRAGPTAAELAAQEKRSRRKLDYIPAARFREARARVNRATTTQGSPVHVSADNETSYTLVMRTDTSDIEQHARWDDLVIVQSGRGVLQIAKGTTGRRRLRAGEYRGGEFVGMHELALSAGDMARVPAGVPHAFAPSGPEPFEYVIVRIRRADRPLEPE